MSILCFGCQVPTRRTGCPKGDAHCVYYHREAEKAHDHVDDSVAQMPLDERERAVHPVRMRLRTDTFVDDDFGSSRSADGLENILGMRDRVRRCADDVVARLHIPSIGNTERRHPVLGG